MKCEYIMLSEVCSTIDQKFYDTIYMKWLEISNSREVESALVVV